MIDRKRARIGPGGGADASLIAKRATLGVVAALVLGGTWLITTGPRDGGRPEPSAAVQFRCGYEAQRAGIEDPECAELRRPNAPSAVDVAAPALVAGE